MNLTNLEKDIEMMEKTLEWAKHLTKDVAKMDNQVDLVRHDLEKEYAPVENTEDLVSK